MKESSGTYKPRDSFGLAEPKIPKIATFNRHRASYRKISHSRKHGKTSGIASLVSFLYICGKKITFFIHLIWIVTKK